MFFGERRSWITKNKAYPRETPGRRTWCVAYVGDRTFKVAKDLGVTNEMRFALDKQSAIILACILNKCVGQRPPPKSLTIFTE